MLAYRPEISGFRVNKNLLILISLIFIYIDYELFFASPGVLISVFTFFYFSPWLFKHISILVTIAIFSMIVTFRPEHSIFELAKYIFVCGSFMLILHLRNNIKFPYIILSLFFILELFLRVLSGDGFGGLYSIKSSGGLFQDSNFTGLFLAVILAALYSSYQPIRKYTINPIRINYLIFFGILLLLTFSRTSILFFIFLVITKYSLRLGLLALAASILMVLLIFLQPSLFLGEIDGSLEARRKIFQGFMLLISQGTESTLFGLGRDGAFDATASAAGAKFAGHTIWGQFVEFGIVLTFIYYYTAYLFIKKLYGKEHLFILIPILSIAVLGLSPLSYLGMLSFLYYLIERNMRRFHEKKTNQFNLNIAYKA